MKKVILRLDAGVAGTDSAEAYLVTELEWDIYQGRKKGYDALGDFAWQQALSHAEMYGIYPTFETPDDYDEEAEDALGGDEYSDNIEGYFEEYDPEQHDGLVPGGGEWDFQEI